MTNGANTSENSSSPQEPIEWVKKSAYESNDEVRILSQKPAGSSLRQKILFVIIVGLSITVIGGTPAISGELPDLARAVLLVGGTVVALFSFPKVLYLVTKLFSGGPPKNHYNNAIANRRVDRRHKFNKTLQRGKTIYRIFK